MDMTPVNHACVISRAIPHTEQSKEPPRRTGYTKMPPNTQREKHQVQALAFGEPQVVIPPCVDCRKFRASWCDKRTTNEDCYLKKYMHPKQFETEGWPGNKKTHCCTICNSHYPLCHLCHGMPGATPPGWGSTRITTAVCLPPHVPDLTHVADTQTAFQHGVPDGVIEVPQSLIDEMVEQGENNLL